MTLQTSPIGSEWQFDPTWEIPINAESTSGLRNALSYLTKGGKLSPERICQRMAMFLRDAYIPSHDLISRLTKSRNNIYRFKNRDHYVTLVFFIGRLMKEAPDLFKQLHDQQAERFLQFSEQYFEQMSLNPRFRDRYIVRDTKDLATRSASSTLDMVRVINHLALPEDAVLQASRLVFTPGEIAKSSGGDPEEEKYFIAYRYGVDVGQIFKSSVSISRKRGTNSPLIYSCLLKDRMGNLRETLGFGLSIHNKLYLIGNLNTGEAIEITAFSEFFPTRNINSGLTMTVSATGQLISSRVVFKKLPKRLDGSETGRKPLKNIEQEIKDFKDIIANRVEFALEHNLLFDGRKINQGDMVSKVAELLTHRDDDRPMFTYENGDPFNPASSKEYTFNSALREFSSNND
jgi:hypothetical protein